MRMFQRFLDTMSQNLSPILLNRSETSPFHPPFKIKSPTKPINTDFVRHIPLFKLAESSLIQVILIWLSIPFCIDSLYFFHTLFFVSHIFSTNPVPLHFFIIVCSSGGLQVGWTIQRIIVRWFASSPMGIII